MYNTRYELRYDKLQWVCQSGKCVSVANDPLSPLRSERVRGQIRCPTGTRWDNLLPWLGYMNRCLLKLDSQIQLFCRRAQIPQEPEMVRVVRPSVTLIVPILLAVWSTGSAAKPKADMAGFSE